MINIQLLDCTLRDGGYNNDWDFGHNTLVNIFERVVSAGLDYIEIGFLDHRREFDINRSIMPDTESVNKIFGGLDKKRTKVVAMIDYGTCDITHIKPSNESFLDGFRVIFKMHLMHEALAYCQQLKELGYLVFAQAVSFTTYSEEKMLELIGLVNTVNPFALSIVDTYGLMFINHLSYFYEFLNRHLDPNIMLGYHAHNNFQLAFSNCIELAKIHGNRPRTLLLDGTIYGMGKGAGNAPLELLIRFMNETFGTHYDICQILEAIDGNIMDLYKMLHWGYSLKPFIAASNDCHPEYVSYLLDKQTLSVRSINTILQQLKGDAKLLYSKSYIEELYTEYQFNQRKTENDYEKLSGILENNEILVIGPGASILEEESNIIQYIKNHNPIVIAINYIPEQFNIKFLFLTNSKRYLQQATHISKFEKVVKTIATSNLTKSSGSFDFNFDYESLIDREAVFMDNSFIMLLKILIKCNVNAVALAGFDGYSSDRESNYFSSKMEYEHAKRLGNEINSYVNIMLKEMSTKIGIKFVTPTLYRY